MRASLLHVRERARSDDRGSATIWMIGVVVISFVMVGLLLDGGTMLRSRSDAYASASAAARVGAQQLDQSRAVEGVAVLDPIAAEQAALDFLSSEGLAGSVRVEGDTVTVDVTATAQLQMLKLVGGNTADFHASASAQAVKVIP